MAVHDPTVTIRAASITRGRDVVVTIDALDLRPGYAAVVGPNGSGKSTVLHAIAGLLPVRGDISVLGDQPGAHRSRVAYVMQAQHASEHLLVTAREVVTLGRAAVRGPFARMTRADHVAIDRAMERLEVSDLGRLHLAEMSGGQRQRIFVAQGLAQEADVLLLDEPVAGLDGPAVALIRDVVAEERELGRTIVVATHDLADAARADQVVLLDKRVVAAGSPDDALSPENLRAAYGGRVLDLGAGVVAIDDGVHHADHEHHHHDHHDHG